MNTGSLLLGCFVALLFFVTVRGQPDPGGRLGGQIETCIWVGRSVHLQIQFLGEAVYQYNVFVNMCVCMYVCMCTCICMCECMYVCTSVHTSVCVYVCVWHLLLYRTKVNGLHCIGFAVESSEKWMGPKHLLLMTYIKFKSWVLCCALQKCWQGTESISSPPPPFGVL